MAITERRIMRIKPGKWDDIIAVERSGTNLRILSITTLQSARRAL